MRATDRLFAVRVCVQGILQYSLSQRWVRARNQNARAAPHETWCRDGSHLCSPFFEECFLAFRLLRFRVSRRENSSAPLGRKSTALETPKQGGGTDCNDWCYGRAENGRLPRRETAFRTGTQRRVRRAPLDSLIGRSPHSFSRSVRISSLRK